MVENHDLLQHTSEPVAERCAYIANEHSPVALADFPELGGVPYLRGGTGALRRIFSPLFNNCRSRGASPNTVHLAQHFGKETQEAQAGNTKSTRLHVLLVFGLAPLVLLSHFLLLSERYWC